jgi:ribosomal protein S18 acetylase RimI-like enzyme
VSVAIRRALTKDYTEIADLLLPVMGEGESYALDPSASRETVLEYWRKPGNTVYVAEVDGYVAGSYFIRQNAGGGGSHIANCGYATGAAHRRLGIGRAMAIHSIELARQLMFTSIVFNFVVASNSSAVHLWKSLDFHECGRVVDAFRRPNGELVDVLIMQLVLKA